MIRSLVAATLLMGPLASRAEEPPPSDYAGRVAPILQKYCAGCHNEADREGDFSVESYTALREGSPKGPAVVPGDGASSRMIRHLDGTLKPVMPPKEEPRPTDPEVAILKGWIDAGAVGPKGEPADRMALVVPKIASKAGARPILGLEASRDGRWLATARLATVEIRPASGDAPARALTGFPGQVTSVHFSMDGKRLVTASGVAGLGGEAALWKVEDGSLVRKFRGHRDLLFDAELSPDGKLLATAGYDRAIRLWDAESGKLLRTLEGHNGAVYDLAYSPDGRFLVSASADDTCKVWRVADGLRMDTLTQPLKEEYACAFSPDGRSIVAGGADNTIRVWEFTPTEGPRINPMVTARFAHEGPIVRLAFTPDGSRLVTTAEDRSIKAWDAAGFAELRHWEAQRDVASALAIAADGRSFQVGRMDGSTESYPLPDARETSKAAPAGLPVAVALATAEARRADEHEPNDGPDRANDLDAPAVVAGAIDKGGAGRPDSDLFRFAAKAGETWVIEVDAARSGSKLDSFVEVLDARGGRIERARLQAVRDSYFTFRGKDDSISDDFRVFNWEEMSLNEYLYANGEVVKLWLYPRGPDSGFRVYPGEGKRWGYFDTTPLAHAPGGTLLRGRAPPARRGTRPQRPAGLPGLLRERRRVPPGAGQGLQALVHRAGRRQVPGQGPRRPGGRGARLSVHPDDPPEPPRLPGRGQAAGPRGRGRRRPGIPGQGPAHRRVRGADPRRRRRAPARLRRHDPIGDRGRPGRGPGGRLRAGRRPDALARPGQGEPDPGHRHHRGARGRPPGRHARRTQAGREAPLGPPDPRRRGPRSRPRRPPRIRDPPRADDRAQGQGRPERPRGSGPPGERGGGPEPPARGDRRQPRAQRPAHHRGPGRADLLPHRRQGRPPQDRAFHLTSAAAGGQASPPVILRVRPLPATPQEARR